MGSAPSRPSQYPLQHSRSSTATQRYLHDLFRHDLDELDAPAQPPAVSFTALGGLTNLQALTVSCRRVGVSFDDVAQLLQLRTCILGFRSLPGLVPATQRRPTGLAHISTLAALQYLSLAEWVCPDSRPAQELGLTAADCAALTASSELTFLDLSMWQLQPELCSAAFPPKLQLPLLQELRLGPCFVQDPATTACVVSAAPNLISLKVTAVDSSVYEYQEHYEAEVLGEVCVQGFEQLTNLQLLELDDVRMTNPNMWDVLAQMTQLTELKIESVSIPCLPGILQLTALTSLQDLKVQVQHLQDDGYTWSSVRLAGGYAALFGRLPAQVVKCATDILNMAMEEEVIPAVPLLLDAAPAACTAALEAFDQVEQRVTSMLSEETADEVANVGKYLAGVSLLEESTERDLEAVENALAVPADSAAVGEHVDPATFEKLKRRSAAKAAESDEVVIEILAVVLSLQQLVPFNTGSFMVAAGQKLLVAVQKLRQIVQQLTGDDDGDGEGDLSELRERVAYGCRTTRLMSLSNFYVVDACCTRYKRSSSIPNKPAYTVDEMRA